MEMFQCALIALAAYGSWLASPWLGGQGIGYDVFGKPLVAGLIVGLIMGDVTNGIIIGATINAIYIGAITPGGAMASDLNIAGYVGTAIALSAGIAPEMAITIAVPLGLLGTLVWQLFATINSFLVHKTDEVALSGNEKMLTFYVLGIPQILAFILRFIPIFIVLLFGSQVAKDIVNVTPEWLTHALTIIGGMLPAVGMAVLLKMIATEMEMIGFFVIGFLSVAVLNMSVFSVTALGISFSLLIMFIINNLNQHKTIAASSDIRAEDENAELIDDLDNLPDFNEQK